MKSFVIAIVLAFVALNTSNVFFGDEAQTPKTQTPETQTPKTQTPENDTPAVKEVNAKDAAEEKPSVWMRMKLKSTEGVLTGLASGDFQAIEENARRMNTFSQLERLARGKNEDYQLQLKYFRYANRELIRQAGDENLEGATMAFMQLTTSCVNCHRAIRDAAAGDTDAQPRFTHVIRREVHYYVGGPQQARPPEGKFAKGTKVRFMKAAGSYTQVKSEGGVVAFVSTDALTPSNTQQQR